MKKSPLFIIFLVVFIDLLGFGLVIPILPYYASQYGADAFKLGWLMAIYSLAQFLFAPAWGRLSDLFGRRPIIVLTVLGTAMAHGLVAWAPSLAWIFAGRLLAGLFGGNISTATAYIADVTTPENRAKGMGIIGAGFGLGFIFGPALGGILAKYGFGAPALAAAGLALLNAVAAAFLLPEPPLTKTQRSADRHKRFDTSAIRGALARPASRHVIVLFFIVTMAFTQMEACFALFMRDRFGFNAMQAGWLLAYMGVIMVLLQGGLIHRLVKKFGEAPLAMVGMTLMAGALVALSVSPSLGATYFAMTLIALGQGLNNPSLMSLVSKSAPPGETGAVMGVYQSAGSLARVFGPPLAGLLYDRVSSGAPFWMSGSFMAFGAVLAALWLVLGITTTALSSQAR
jgi:MFS family permease